MFIYQNIKTEKHDMKQRRINIKKSIRTQSLLQINPSIFIMKYSTKTVLTWNVKHDFFAKIVNDYKNVD